MLMATKPKPATARVADAPDPPAVAEDEKNIDPGPATDGPKLPTAPVVVSNPTARVIITAPSPPMVDLAEVAQGDKVTTDPDTAARLIKAGYAVPDDSEGDA
jgi:hypothetical protein